MMIAFVILFVLVAAALPLCVFVVKGKTAAIIETFGKPNETAALPGLHFKAPWPIQVVVGQVNLQQQQVKADVTVKTNDDAFLTLPVSVQYRASEDPKGAVKAYYELREHEKQIVVYVLNKVRHTTAGMSMAELYENRDKISEEVKRALTQDFEKYGYIIEGVIVDQPNPSNDVRDAFNKVIASKRLQEAATYEAEAIKVKLVGTATAEAESKKLQGEGMANMREAIAKGLREAMNTMREAGLEPEQAVKVLSDTNRLDTISTAAAHGNMILVDMSGQEGLANTLVAVKAATKEKAS